MLGNCPQLKIHLGNKRLIPLGRHLFSGGINVNQSTNKTRLSVRDLDRFVRTHEQEGVDLRRIARLVLLIHRHFFVRRDRVQLGIVFDLAQVAVVLNRYERVVLEDFGGEGI